MIDVPTVEPFLEPHHAALVPALVAFVEEQVAPLPYADHDATARVQARLLLRRLGAAGLLRHAHPLDLRACCLVREALAWASPLADEVFALQALGSLPIALAGSPAQQARWLPAVAAGEAMAAFAMTEPGAGSDVAALALAARPDGDGWVLEGEKWLISNAGIADFYTVFARTGPDAGARGISCFIVPAETPGLELVGAQVLSAPHPLGHLRFSGCRLGAEALLGEPGRGFHLGMRTLDALRVSVGAAACGMATRALDEALRHVKERRQFGQRLADLQLVQGRLARMATQRDASRLMVYRAARQRDRVPGAGGIPSGGAAGAGGGVSGPSAMAKLFATEAAQGVVDDAVQLIGGRGVLADAMVDRLYRAVRPLRIYEGATDVQYLVIARALLG